MRAYDVPKAIADNVDPIMSQSARDHRNDPYGATSEFVRKLAGVNVAAGAQVTTSPVADAKHSSWAWLWVMLIFVFALIVGLIWLPARNRKRRKDAEAQSR